MPTGTIWSMTGGERDIDTAGAVLRAADELVALEMDLLSRPNDCDAAPASR